MSDKKVTVKTVIRGARIEGKWIMGSLSIVDDAGNQIGARGWRAPFGKDKAETIANCKAAIKEALKPVGKQYQKEADMLDPVAEHLDQFNNRSLDYSYPDETVVMGDEVPLMQGEGAYGPL